MAGGLNRIGSGFDNAKLWNSPERIEMDKRKCAFSIQAIDPEKYDKIMDAGNMGQMVGGVAGIVTGLSVAAGTGGLGTPLAGVLMVALPVGGLIVGRALASIGAVVYIYEDEKRVRKNLNEKGIKIINDYFMNATQRIGPCPLTGNVPINPVRIEGYETIYEFNELDNHQKKYGTIPNTKIKFKRTDIKISLETISKIAKVATEILDDNKKFKSLSKEAQKVVQFMRDNSAKQVEKIKEDQLKILLDKLINKKISDKEYRDQSNAIIDAVHPEANISCDRAWLHVVQQEREEKHGIELNEKARRQENDQ